MPPKRHEGPALNKQTGYYFADFYVGFGEERKRVRISLRTKDPEKALWLWEQEYRRQWSRFYGIEPPIRPSTIRFSKIADEYVEYERDVKKIKEWKLYEQRLTIIQKCWGDVQLEKISRRHFIELDKWLRQGGRSNYTINHYMTLLRGLFNYAIKNKKYRDENPAAEIRPYTVDRKRRELTPDELSRILEAASEVEKEADPRGYVERHAKRIIQLLLYTAMRNSELFTLKWGEHVKEDKIVLKRTETKQQKEKIIPITDAIQRILDEFKADGDPGDYVIPLAPGINRENVSVYGMTQKIRKKTGISDFILYNIKHTAATVMIKEALGRGASLEDIMKILGHSQLETTLRYVHADFDRMKKAMGALEDIVDKQ